MIKLFLIAFLISIVVALAVALICVIVKALRLQRNINKNKCKYCSQCMRAFCKSTPNRCDGPYDW